MGMIDKGEAGTEPSPADGLSSREVILDAAEQLMALHGYADTSISAICKASGLPVGSLYHHFGNKSGILAAVLERGNRQFSGGLDAMVDATAGPDERMRQYYGHAPELLMSNVAYFRILHSSLTSCDMGVPERLAENNEAVARRLAAVIEPVVREAGIADPGVLALQLARFSAVYAAGAMLVSGYVRERVFAEMAPLHEVVRTMIASAASATGPQR
ncbi:TetR/AcrR family transcriptional regulator [Streptomyces sp. NPDC026665]|uniref:TetR/AcrR family transcriptional regulator n=1 Tax=Streptomyces sp. NPDC026665 TaxID=3154798 RepID=UPI0033EB0718